MALRGRGVFLFDTRNGGEDSHEKAETAASSGTSADHARFSSRIEPYLYLLPFLIGIARLYAVSGHQRHLHVLQGGTAATSRASSPSGAWATTKRCSPIPSSTQAIVNTLKYVVLVVPISTCIAVVVAYLLNQKLRFSALFQTAYFLPMVTSITAVGLAWRLMYNERFGIINYMLSWFGVDPIGWLTKAQYSMPALVIFGIWNILPFTIILLLSGLQNIDEQYYTAAKVDGARSLRIFFRITVPLLAPTIFLVCIVNTISSFKVFSGIVPALQGRGRAVLQPLYGGVLHTLRDDGKPRSTAWPRPRRWCCSSSSSSLPWCSCSSRENGSTGGDRMARRRIARFFMYFFLSVGAIIMIFPFFWMFASAFKLPTEINKFPPPVAALVFEPDQLRDRLLPKRRSRATSSIR